MTSRRGTGKLRTRTRRKARHTDPDLIMLLADPEVRLLMRADSVDEAELRKMLAGISIHLRNLGKKRRSNADSGKYRRGVGIMLLNDNREVFIARRNDVAGEAWQMPQGGIDSRESAQRAAFRELKEEIGTDNVEIIAESKGWFYYDLPNDLAKKAWGGGWRGQRQKWFVMLFKGKDAEINLETAHPEFDAWRWLPVHELESLAVSFKRHLYMSILNEFAAILRG